MLIIGSVCDSEHSKCYSNATVMARIEICHKVKRHNIHQESYYRLDNRACDSLQTGLIDDPCWLFRPWQWIPEQALSSESVIIDA
jgi:hypothetical protein